jgi:integral membrane protein
MVGLILSCKTFHRINKSALCHLFTLIYLAVVSQRLRGDVAQWLEQSAHNRLVPGSSPGIPTKAGLTMNHFYKKYRSFRPFSKHEAWLLFKLSAWAESVGWTLLIIGITLKYQLLNGNDVPVKIAGQIHGTFFLIYFVAAIVLAPSLRWSGGRTLVAICCSVPPYGSLVLEMWMSHKMKIDELKTVYRLQYYAQSLSILAKKGLLVDN